MELVTFLAISTLMIVGGCIFAGVMWLVGADIRDNEK